MTLLREVVEVLERSKIPYALIGAAAMAAHGVSRSTYDTDLFAVGDAALNATMWQALRTQGIDVDVRHGDDDDPLLGVVRCSRDDQTIDVVVGRYDWQRAILARAVSAHVFSIDLPIVTLEDLILLKLYAGGSQDRWDIEQLLASAASASVVAEVTARVRQLPARSQHLWRSLIHAL